MLNNLSKYKSLSDWRLADPKAYVKASQMGILTSVCEKFGWKTRNKWGLMSDSELIEKTITQAKTIKSINPDISQKEFLDSLNSPLKHIRKRKLKERLYNELGFNLNIKYENMSDKELLEHTKKYCLENNLKSISGLNSFTGYKYLKKKGLVNELKNSFGWEDKRINWESLNDDDLLSEYIKINNGGHVSQINLSGYQQIKKRNLVEKLHDKLSMGTKKQIAWKKMSDEELLDYMVNIYLNNNCVSLKTLEECSGVGSGGLLNLRNRIGINTFFEKVNNPKKINKWNKLSDDDLINAGFKMINENNIDSLEKLKKQKNGGDSIVKLLRNRNLLPKLLKKTNLKTRKVY